MLGLAADKMKLPRTHTLCLFVHAQIGEFKERLASVLDLAANKMKLSRDIVGFLRDEPSLAHYNVGPGVQLTLGIKEGRGRKKG